MKRYDTTSKVLFYGLLGLAGVLVARNINKIVEVATPADIDDELRFLRLMKPIAENVYHNKGIKTIITISQAALESNWGISRIAREANNLFGMTAGSGWTGETIIGEKSRKFRKYNNWQESADDWARLISTSTRYVNLYKYAKSGDIRKFGAEVHTSGYAEDENYQTALVNRASEVNKYV
jgi:flagellum-specific peptidoglycan hydrolase FlgJ